MFAGCSTQFSTGPPALGKVLARDRERSFSLPKKPLHYRVSDAMPITFFFLGKRGKLFERREFLPRRFRILATGVVSAARLPSY